MKYICISIFLLLVFAIWTVGGTIGGTIGVCSDISLAESDIEVIGEEPPEYEEEEPITQEMIDQEEELLEQKIREINETPVEEFGSMIQKRKQRAYYTYRLNMLRDSPEKYFKTKTDE